MNKICTDIEQSKKLIELGIDINTADMWYLPIKHNEETLYELVTSESLTRGIIPAWSLSALLKLMPNYRFESYADGTHFANYESFGLSLINHRTEGKTPIDAAFKMVCWLKENKKI